MTAEPGGWKRWLVQVKAGEWIGTGYPLGPRRVLTARHVVEEGEVEVRFVRLDREQWLPATVVWPRSGASEDAEALDVALLELSAEAPRGPVVAPAFFPAAGEPWEAEGFPEASFTRGEGGVETPQEPLLGSTCSVGPGDRDWKLDVGAHPRADEGWRGFSGAPVMLRGRLGGILTELPRTWSDRIDAVPLSAFWSDEAFQAALGGETVRRLRDRSLETLKEQLVHRLEPAWLRERLAQELRLETDPGKSEVVAKALLGTSALALAVVLYNLAVEAEDAGRAADGRLVEDLARSVLPLAREPLEALEQALRQKGRSELLLNIETPIVAELLNAALDGRAAAFEVRGEELVGRTLVPYPEVPVVRQEGFENALRSQLALQLRIAAGGLPPEDVDRRIDARLRVLSSESNPRPLGYYFLLRGSAVARSDRQTLGKYPGLRLLELGGKSDEELQLAEWVRLLFGREDGRDGR